MTKASKAINLVLISSSMIVAGCYRSQSTTAQDTRAGNSSGAHSGGGFYGVRGGRTVFIPSGGGGRGWNGVSGSPRGGFGASGLAHAGS